VWYAVSSSVWTTTPQPESSASGMNVPTIAVSSMRKPIVPPARWRPSRNAATIGTFEKSAASGCAGSECAMMRPRGSTRYTWVAPLDSVVIARIGCRLATPSTTPSTRPCHLTGSPITITGSWSESETTGTETIGVPLWPRWKPSWSCSCSLLSWRSSPATAAIPPVSTTPR